MSEKIVETVTTIRESPTHVNQPRPVPVVHDTASRTQEQLLDRLVAFNSHVEHIARVESILIQDMGLSKEDAGVFIRAGVDGVFGKSDHKAMSYAPQVKLADPDAFPGVWMNELQESFDEKTYFVKRAKSVFVSITGSYLSIRQPEKRVVNRLSYYDEQIPPLNEVAFAVSREYNLLNADVFLLPLDVPVKIRWLQRFPIAIKLKNPVTKGRPPMGKDNVLAVEKGADDPRFLGKDESTLILFARCDREKEELYWKFIKASGKIPYAISLAPIQLSADMKPLDLFFHRLFGDVLVEPAWNTTIVKKIEAKLSQMKRPQYLEQLKVVEVDLGKRLPSFGEVAGPRIDGMGVWFEVDFDLRGPMVVTLVTSLNPFKLTHPDKENKAAEGDSEDKKKVSYSALADLYGGYESDEFEEDTEVPEKSKSKLTRFVETIAESKAMQYFTEIGFIRKELEKVADAELKMTVVVEMIRGRIAINIPHPPSDRMWYGFLPKPDIVVKAMPTMGHTEVKYTMITDFIEKALVKEINQVLTIPNMDDITIPFANSGIDPEEYRLSKLNDFILRLT